MIRNILFLIWFCITSFVSMSIALCKMLPELCEELRAAAEKVERDAELKSNAVKRKGL